ncbi:MAG: glycosyltransferase, partial [Nonlabens ulvanivorans]
MISIIIPVLNEEHSIYQLLTHLVEKSSDVNTIEIIVIDGHSIDNTDGQV